MKVPNAGNGDRTDEEPCPKGRKIVTETNGKWERTTAASQGMDLARLEQACAYALTGGGSGCVAHGGKLVMTWGDQHRRYDIKSSTKSIGVTALGLAIADGIADLHDKARTHCEEIAESSNTGDPCRDDITLQHLATMTAGFAKDGGCHEPVFTPGSTWAYSDASANWRYWTEPYEPPLLNRNRVTNPRCATTPMREESA